LVGFAGWTDRGNGTSLRQPSLEVIAESQR
jgi:hypothetical protein